MTLSVNRTKRTAAYFIYADDLGCEYMPKTIAQSESLTKIYGNFQIKGKIYSWIHFIKIDDLLP